MSLDIASIVSLAVRQFLLGICQERFGSWSLRELVVQFGERSQVAGAELSEPIRDLGCDRVDSGSAFAEHLGTLSAKESVVEKSRVRALHRQDPRQKKIGPQRDPIRNGSNGTRVNVSRMGSHEAIAGPRLLLAGELTHLALIRRSGSEQANSSRSREATERPASADSASAEVSLYATR